jgi:hypothetical protein
MRRIAGAISALLGLVAILAGAIPSGLLGRLNGLGTNSHLTADVVAAVGVLLLLAGAYLVVWRKSS